VGSLLEIHRESLLRVVRRRLDPQLSGRLGASDVVQESFLEATRRLPEYLRLNKMPFFLWLRLLTVQKLLALKKHHRAKMRDPRKEVAIRQPDSTAGTRARAASPPAKGKDPVEAAMRAEAKASLRKALRQMDPGDRQVLVLRHLKNLTSAEAASALGIREDALRQRHLRALYKLRRLMKAAGPTAE
jgi:RNA polymerase sigma-70 factor, ECF subfamily